MAGVPTQDRRESLRVEYGANRIAAAYWRLKDPGFMERTEKKMTTVIATMPPQTIPTVSDT